MNLSLILYYFILCHILGSFFWGKAEMRVLWISRKFWIPDLFCNSRDDTIWVRFSRVLCWELMILLENLNQSQRNSNWFASFHRKRLRKDGRLGKNSRIFVFLGLKKKKWFKNGIPAGFGLGQILWQPAVWMQVSNWRRHNDAWMKTRWPILLCWHHHTLATLTSLYM